MDEIKLKLKSGKDVVLDFNNYTFWEYSFNSVTIKLNSKLIDSSNEIYTVDRILFDSVILKDSNNISINFPKEEIHKMRLYKMKTKITPEKQIEDSKSIIKAVLNLDDVHDDMKRKVIDTMLWNITGANGKYNLSYISVLAKDNPKLKVNHEHVCRKKTMIDKIMLEPHNVERILEQAVGCVVTVEEHKLLREIEKENKEIDGWDRYKLAQIKVYDNKNKKILEWQ